VGVCSPDFVPFIITDNVTGQVGGYDANLWDAVYRRARVLAAQSGDPAVADYFPTYDPPTFVGTPFPDLVARLEQGTVDVGLCGIYESPERTDKMDFLSPYLASGMRAMVRSVRVQVDEASIMELVIGFPSPRATLALLCLCGVAIAFSHLIWLVEKDPNPRISPRYFNGVWDSFWLALVTATTVGYGDKCPVTYAGKLLTIAWMLVGSFFFALYAASLTTQVLEDRSMDHSPEGIDFSDLNTLMHYTVGVSFSVAAQALSVEVPNAKIRMFDTQKESLDALVRGDVNVVIEDAWQAEYIKQEASYRGLLTVSGNLFWAMDSCIAVSRPGGKEHPVRDVLATALLTHMRGPERLSFELSKARWFGETLSSSSLASEDYNSQLDALVSQFNRSLMYGLAGLLVVWCGLAVWANKSRIVAKKRRNYLKHKLGIKADMSQEQVRNVLRKHHREWCSEASVSHMRLSVLLPKLSSLRQAVTERDLQKWLNDFHQKKALGSFDLATEGERLRNAASIWKELGSIARATEDMVKKTSSLLRAESWGRVAGKHRDANLSNTRNGHSASDHDVRGITMTDIAVESGSPRGRSAHTDVGNSEHSVNGSINGTESGRVQDGLFSFLGSSPLSSTPFVGTASIFGRAASSSNDTIVTPGEFIFVMETLMTPEDFELHKLEKNTVASKGDLAEMRHAMMRDLSAMQRKIMTEVQNVPAMVLEEKREHTSLEKQLFERWAMIARQRTQQRTMQRMASLRAEARPGQGDRASRAALGASMDGGSNGDAETSLRRGILGRVSGAMWNPSLVSNRRKNSSFVQAEGIKGHGSVPNLRSLVGSGVATRPHNQSASSTDVMAVSVKVEGAADG